MNRKSILFVVNGLYGGGAEKVAQTLLNHLDPERYDVTVYSLRREAIRKDIYTRSFRYKYFFNSVDDKDSVWKRFAVKAENKLKLIVYYHSAPSFFYRLMVKEKYDVEIAFIEGYATRIVSGSDNPDSKKLAWLHIDLEKNHWTSIAYRNAQEEKRAYEKMDAVYAVSESVRGAFEREIGVLGKAAVQYNAVDSDEVRDKSRLPLPEAVSAYQGLKLVTVGRLEEQKGYDRLLLAVAKLKPRQFKYKIWIVGEGSQREKLENMIAENNLGEYVELTGYQENPYPWMNMADAFVCTSRAEGFSTVATEALLLGKPIFTTRCAGMEELFGSCRCGRIFDNSQAGIDEMFDFIFSEAFHVEDYAAGIEERRKYFQLSVRMVEIDKILGD